MGFSLPEIPQWEWYPYSKSTVTILNLTLFGYQLVSANVKESLTARESYLRIVEHKYLFHFTFFKQPIRDSCCLRPIQEAVSVSSISKWESYFHDSNDCWSWTATITQPSGPSLVLSMLVRL